MSFEKLLKPTIRGVQPIPEQAEEKPNFFVDTLMGVPRGLEGAVQSIYDLADFATGDVLPDYDTRFLGRSKRFGGTMTEGITQFLTGFIPVAGQLSKVGKLSKLNKVGKRVLNLKGAATAGAVADFTMFQAQEERLSNLIEAFPSLSNPITEYLEADGDDGELEGRLKNTLEGLAIGGVVDSLIGGVKAIKRSRKGDDPESIMGVFYDSYNQQKNDELLTQDTLETESFRETIDKAFEAKFGGTIVNEGTPVNAYDALQTFDEVYTGELKPIITALLDKASNSLRETEVSFDLHTTTKGEKVGSEYRNNRISMGQGGARTFVHEMLHAVTSKELDFRFTEIAEKLNLENPDNMMAGRLVAGNQETLELVAKNADSDPIAGLANAYLKVIKALGREEHVFQRTNEQIKNAERTFRDLPYGLVNIDEFISEAFTNPEFRKILAELPSETQNRSMFDEFMDSLLRILGLDKSQGSVLRDVFKYTDDIVTRQNEEYAGALDYIESFAELSGRIKRNANKKPTGKPDSYYDDLYESGAFGQDRTLDNRTGGFRKTETIGRMSPITLRENPDKVYLFGDNLEGKGKGGQAVVRDEPNAIGIPTKKAPRRDAGAYFNDADLQANKEAIDEAFNKIPDEATVVIPKDGLGTGLADLANKAPKTFKYLQEKLAELQTASVRDGIQKDDMIPERGRTLEPFEVDFGRPFRGKDISEVPDSYLRKALEFDSIPDKTKARISEELDARDAGEANRPDDGFVKSESDEPDVNSRVSYQKGIQAVREAEKRGEGISVLRKKGDQHYGNPFSHLDNATDTILTKDLEETVANYEKWLKGTDFKDVRPELRAWVIKQIDEGKLDGKALLYYSKQQPNHAEVLDAFIKSKRGTALESNKFKAARLMVGRGRAEIDSPLTKGEILEPNVATARERYQRYVKAQGGTGGKASPASMSFKEYMENYGITHTTVHNKRGKVIGSKETDEFTSAKFRKEARKFKEEGGFGQDSLNVGTERKKVKERLTDLIVEGDVAEDIGPDAFIFRAGNPVGAPRVEAEKGKDYAEYVKLQEQEKALDEIQDAKGDLTELLVNGDVGEDFGPDAMFRPDVARTFDPNAPKVEGEKGKDYGKYVKLEEKISKLEADYIKKYGDSDSGGFGQDSLKEINSIAKDSLGKVPTDVIKGINPLSLKQFKDHYFRLLDPDPFKGKELQASREIKEVTQRVEPLLKEVNKEGLIPEYSANQKKQLTNALEEFIGAHAALSERGITRIDGLDKVHTNADAVLRDAEKLLKQENEGGFGQDSIDDFIEDRINQTSREIGDVNTTGGKQAILNMAKNIRTSKHALALISGIARNLNESGVKQKVTKEELAAETEKTADILGGDKNTWLTAVRGLNDSIPDLQQFRDSQRAAKTLMDLMSRNIVDTARKAVKARTSDALNLQRLETEFISKLDQLTEVQRIYSLMGREAGLTLLQRNFLGNAKGKYRLNDNVGFDFVAGDPESYARYTTQSVGGKNVKETINEFVMYGTDEQVQKGVAEVSGDNLTRGVVKGAKGMFGSKLMRMTVEYWINSLLSGPTTQFVNMIGSGLTTAIRMGELAMGSVMAGDSATRRAIFQYAFSMESISEALKFAGKAWRINDSVLVQGSRQFDDQLRRNEMITGENVMEVMGKGRKALGGTQDAVSGAIDFIGKGVRLPSRGLMTVDEFFKQLNYRTYVRTNIAMEALNKNPELTGKELAKIVSEDFDKYITDGGRAYNEGNLYLDAIEKVKGDGIEYGSDQATMIQQELARNPFDPSRSALANSAKNYAEVNTFTNELDNDTVVGKVGNMLGNAKQELGGLNFIIPFVRTPTNILQFSLDRTPLGLAQRGKELLFRKEGLTDALASQNPMEVALAKGKIATGVAFSSAMIWYAMSNKEFITGHGPQNKDEKDALKASGWQPYSFRIPNGKGGHNYWSYQRLDPVSTIIGLFADMAEFEDYHDIEGPVLKDLFAMTALSFTQNVTNKSYVKGLDTLLNAFKDPVNNAQGVAGNIVGGFMPSFVVQMQNAGGDRTLRETRTVFDYFVARGTGAKDLPARRNFLGEATIVKNPKLFGAINPVYFSPESKDPVDQELKSLLHGFSKPNSKLMGAIQLKDIYNEDGRQAYDVWLEKTSTTKIGGKTLRQYLHKMVKSKEYQALPAQSQSDIGEKSPRIKAINSWLRAFRAQAKQEMIEEFPELQNSLNELLQQKQQYRLIQ